MQDLTPFFDGINTAAVSVSLAKGDDGADYLALHYSDTDTVFIKNGADKHFTIDVADGILTSTSLIAQGLTYQGTEQADIITLTSPGNNTVYAGDGDDVITGNIGTLSLGPMVNF